MNKTQICSYNRILEKAYSEYSFAIIEEDKEAQKISQQKVKNAFRNFLIHRKAEATKKYIEDPALQEILQPDFCLFQSDKVIHNNTKAKETSPDFRLRANTPEHELFPKIVSKALLPQTGFKFPKIVNWGCPVQ